jgi:MarR family transcriptional regulator, transcriptional regulator for hemolysin
MEQTLGRRLYLGQRAVSDELDRRLREHGASLWNWVLLREAEHADGLSQRELADVMRIEPPTLVRHLDKLSQDGLVERRRDPEDRRVVRVVVTPAGRERQAQLHQVVHDFDVELRAALSPQQVEVLGDALTRLYEHFGTGRIENEKQKEEVGGGHEH